RRPRALRAADGDVPLPEREGTPRPRLPARGAVRGGQPPDDRVAPLRGVSRHRRAQAGLTGTPLVSAVMVVLDGERFIEEAIRSILDQTYPALELVVVDDGSTDSSAEIVDRLATEATVEVRLVRHPGGARHGMSASRNLGVEQSRGELVAFLDADDV